MKATAAANFTLEKKLAYVGTDAIRLIVILVSLALIAWAIWQSKKPVELHEDQLASPPPREREPVAVGK